MSLAHIVESAAFIAVVILAIWCEVDIQRRRERRARGTREIHGLELDLGLVEPVRNRDLMTNEPGQMIETSGAPRWGPSPMDMAVGRYLREDDPPPAYASIPRWYEEYRRKLRNPRPYVDDGQDLEVW